MIVLQKNAVWTHITARLAVARVDRVFNTTRVYQACEFVVERECDVQRIDCLCDHTLFCSVGVCRRAQYVLTESGSRFDLRVTVGAAASSLCECRPCYGLRWPSRQRWNPHGAARIPRRLVSRT